MRDIIGTVHRIFNNPSFNHAIIARKINTRGTKTYTTLSSLLYHKAANNYPQLGHSIEELIHLGADVNFEHNDDPWPPLSSEEYRMRGRLLILKIVTVELSHPQYSYLTQQLDLREDIRYYEKTALAIAIHNKNDPIARLLLQHHPKKNCMKIALQQHNEKIIDYIFCKIGVTKAEIGDFSRYAARLNHKMISEKIIYYLKQMLKEHYTVYRRQSDHVEVFTFNQKNTA